MHMHGITPIQKGGAGQGRGVEVVFSLRVVFQPLNVRALYTLDVPEDVHIYSMLKVIINMCLTLRSFTVDL